MTETQEQGIELNSINTENSNNKENENKQQDKKKKKSKTRKAVVIALAAVSLGGCTVGCVTGSIQNLLQEVIYNTTGMIFDIPGSTESVRPDHFICYYGCPQSKRVKKLNTTKNKRRIPK